MPIIANKEQEEVIRSVNGPLLVIACPGSGKTTTMIRRIKYMIDSGIEPSSILMVTFTRDAAIEMRTKYKTMYQEIPGCTFNTLHAMCLHLLSEEGRYHKGDLLDGGEAQEHVYRFVIDNGVDGEAWDLAQSILTEISYVKNTYADISVYDADCCETDFFRMAYRDYEAWKEEEGRYDYDDLLVRCLDMLTESASIRKKWQDHYRYIQCDEYQDTNGVQRDILYAMAGDRGNLCVVGDDDQSIYGFRGATPAVMTEFTQHFKNAVVIKLTTNYRSCQAVVDAADALIRFNKDRFAKSFISNRGKNGEEGRVDYFRFPNRQDEIEDILRRIREKKKEGLEYSDMAILVRVNRQITLPISVLSRADIPFFTTERVQSVYSGWIFRDIHAYASLSMGTGTVKEVMRILNHPNRHLDPGKFRVREYSYQEFRRALDYLTNAESWKFDAANRKVREWMNAFGPGKITPATPTAALFDALDSARCSVHYKTYLAEYAKFRKEDVLDYEEEYEDLKKDALRHKTVGEWFAYAEYCIRKVEEESRKKDRSGVRIATMHGSKGLEWPCVFIMDCNEKIVPHKNSMDTPEEIAEERRLLYVAMTRARDELVMYNSSPQESRFLKQIHDSVGINGQKRIPKYLPGKGLSHKRFGHGKVVCYDEGKIEVAFDSGKVTRFSFPDAFLDGFLQYDT